MQKAIHIEQTSNTVARILSITDQSAAEVSPNGQTYITVEYIEPPVLNTNMDVAYPLYNKSTGTMYWMVVNYQTVATEIVIENQNLRLQVSTLEQSLQATQTELATTQQALDAVIMGV